MTKDKSFGLDRTARLPRDRVSLRHLMAGLLACLVLVSTPAMPAFAVEPDEILSDRTLETRARRLSSELRCLVCQNQSIDDSNAPLARDLRVLVRERLKAGDSDQAVMSFIVARYGEFVLLKPPLGWHTLLLWLSPLVLLAGAILMVRRGFSRSIEPVGDAKALTADEKSRLDSLLSDHAAER